MSAADQSVSQVEVLSRRQEELATKYIKNENRVADSKVREYDGFFLFFNESTAAIVRSTIQTTIIHTIYLGSLPSL